VLAIPQGKSVSVESMKIRAALMTFVKVGVVTTGLTACGSRPNKVMADTPVLPYQAPDISEITGIEEPDEADVEEGTTAPAPEAQK
jgi:hypothetical protein